jgi:hypothetical protein
MYMGGRKLYDFDLVEKIFKENVIVDNDVIARVLLKKGKWSEEQELTYQSVTSLDDPRMNWARGDSTDYWGKNGYLLWLAVGATALKLALDQKPPSDVNHGPLHVLIGFEEIFFYLGVYTENGLS